MIARTSTSITLVILAMATMASAQTSRRAARGNPAATQPYATSRPAAWDGFQLPHTVKAGSLTSLSIEDLMNVEVTSVSRQPQRIADAPAAVTVINQEDIDRSGITTLPDLLRMAPGMDVGRLDGNHWAISTRGFNDLYANKLLVMMDGRSVYTGVQSGGVFWNAQDYVLQDLDRIEVVPGPGATMWGSNAVNGVVSIETKSARNTQGWLLSVLGGSEQQDASVRYGGKIDDNTYFRVYGKFANYDNGKTAAGSDANDAWNSGQGGFRVDRYAANDTFTFQGDAYQQDINQTVGVATFVPPYAFEENNSFHADGGNVLGRWTHTISDTDGFSLQLYYDRFDRFDRVAAGFQQNSGDLDFQHHFALGDRQRLVWGFGYRFVADHITSHPPAVLFTPVARDTNSSTPSSRTTSQSCSTIAIPNSPIPAPTSIERRRSGRFLRG